MSNYDAWLEKPYTDRARDEAAYESWCEENDLDFDSDHWDEFESAMDDAREAAAEAAAEARAEADFDDYDY